MNLVRWSCLLDPYEGQLYFSSYLFTCVCVCLHRTLTCVYVCTHECTCTWQGKSLSALPYRFLPYSLETGSFTENGIRLVARKSQWFPCLCAHSPGVTGMGVAILAFSEILRIWMQVNLPAEASPSPRTRTQLLICRYLLSHLCFDSKVLKEVHTSKKNFIHLERSSYI